LIANSIQQTALNIGTSTTTTGNALVTINPSAPSTFVSPGTTTVPTGNSSGTSILTSLSIANAGIGSGTYYGTLDLKNNNLVLNYTGAPNSPDAAIRDALQTAYDGGAWDGKGLTSSSIQLAPADMALGFGENNDPTTALGFDNGGNPFEGTPVNAQSLLVKFTWQDDLTFDGLVDGQDIGIINNNFDFGATTGHTFAQGDLNYDGVIDGQDLGIFNNAFLAESSFAQLPEPSSFVLAGLGLLGLLLARRRRGKTA